MAHNWTPLTLTSLDQHQQTPDSKGYATADGGSVGVDFPLATTATSNKAGLALVNDVKSAPSSAPHDKDTDVSSNFKAAHGSTRVCLPNFFAKRLHTYVSPDYLQRTKAGKHYAVYTLVSLKRDELEKCLEELNLSAQDEQGNVSFTLAPTYDFSNSDGASMRDVFDYHTSLLDTIKSNPRELHPDKFLVLVDEDWKTNGIMVMNLDSDLIHRGVLGMSRVTWSQMASCLFLVENDPEGWAALKTEEGYQCFQTPIKGYTNTKWEKLE